MNKRRSIIVGILICVLVIGVSYFWATSLMDSLYAFRSPLRSSPPSPGEQIGEPETRSLVIVLIDALRYDTAFDPEVMPTLNSLRLKGAFSLMHSRPPSYSEPGYTVILTGAWPDISDGPALNLDYADIPVFTQEDIFSAAKRAGYSTAISGYYWFEKLVPQESVTMSFYTTGEDKLADRQVTDAALPWLGEGIYQLVLIHLDQVDYAGHHEGGPVDPRWNAAASRADGLLDEIASAMDLTKDTLLILSDHGQIDRGGHGGQDTVTLIEPFVMVGKGVIPGKYRDIQMVDIAPTIAAFLGTNIPATNEGRPLVEMINFSLAHVGRINDVLEIQQSQLATKYELAINQRVNVRQDVDSVSATQAGMDAAREIRLNNERIPRGFIGIIFIVFITNLALWRTRPYSVWMLAGVAVYLLIFNLKYILLDGKTYSLSSVLSATDLIISTAMTSLAALVIGWLFVFIGTRAIKAKPQQAADTTLKYILSTLSIAAIPIVGHYVFNGAIVTWTLPDFLLSFLGLLYLIQALIIAAAGILLTPLSSLISIFFNRKTDI